MTQEGFFPRGWRRLRVAGDLVVGPCAFLLAFLIRLYIPIPLTDHLLPGDRLGFFLDNWTLVLATQVVALYFFALYEPPRVSARIELLQRLVAAVCLQGLMLMGYYFLREAVFPRSILVLFVPLNCALLFAWRLLFRRLHPPRVRRVAIVGGGSTALAMAESLRSHHHHGLELAGFIRAPGSSEGTGESELEPVLGTTEDAPGLIADGIIDDVILASESYPWQTRLIDRVARIAPAKGNVWLLPGAFESLLAGTRYYWVGDNPLIEVAREAEWRINRPLKRGMDLVCATGLLALLGPVLLLAAATALITSGRPIFYQQTRLGRSRAPFTIHKLRTMRTGAEQGTGEAMALPDDPRVTPIGRIFRRYRIDEIPQLFNVLAGTMSLVGPRPERPGFADEFENSVPGYAKRFGVTPGVTGLAQVHGDYLSTPQTKVRYDLAYIANWSIWLDFYILLRTIRSVLTSSGI